MTAPSYADDLARMFEAMRELLPGGGTVKVRMHRQTYSALETAGLDVRATCTDLARRYGWRRARLELLDDPVVDLPVGPPQR